MPLRGLEAAEHAILIWSLAQGAVHSGIAPALLQLQIPLRPWRLSAFANQVNIFDCAGSASVVHPNRPSKPWIGNFFGRR
jgi:hypothetical protein